ncbi:ribokinase [Acidianus sulfidivorans JP7]|uniref:Ribokinase n=1 Tax=Acidianus sulfidivorans JP7 TaxID=619593 RepID=A0A2U9INB3_9CREN|nr:ribokinase [Acidianus sulfidivorans]AWR97501.1 ribokinase [Acidianus sulfidivorans JP7]
MITVVGSYNRDIIIKVDEFPAIGETIFAKEIFHSHGGKGSNQAVSAARLGSNVRLIAAVGDDELGKDAINFWRKEGLDISKVKIKRNSRTGSAYILVNKRGETMIVVNRGANFELSEEDIEDAEGILLTQMEIREKVVKKALQSFDGLKILNPAPAVIRDLSILNFVDILTPNEVEFKELTNADDIEYGLQILLKKVKLAVIITLGERGALIATKQKRILIPAPKVTPIDTTGAGDVFNAALAHSLEKNEDIETSVQFANKIAAYSVMTLGAIGPRLEEVKKFLEENNHEK